MKEQVSCRIETDLAERLRNLSHATGVSINWIIEKATEQTVDQMEKAYETLKGHPVPDRPTGNDEAAFQELMEKAKTKHGQKTPKKSQQKSEEITALELQIAELEERQKKAPK